MSSLLDELQPLLPDAQQASWRQGSSCWVGAAGGCCSGSARGQIELLHPAFSWSSNQVRIRPAAVNLAHFAAPLPQGGGDSSMAGPAGELAAGAAAMPDAAAAAAEQQVGCLPSTPRMFDGLRWVHLPLSRWWVLLVVALRCVRMPPAA